jgi:sirohydrochlorin cobaltochelatase
VAEHGIVLFAHGARAASWAQPFERLRDLVEARHVGGPVRLAYLELMAPDLPTVLEQMASAGTLRIDLFPIFLAVGGHLREDLPGTAGDRAVAAPATAHPRASGARREPRRCCR